MCWVMIFAVILTVILTVIVAGIRLLCCVYSIRLEKSVMDEDD